MHNKRTCWCEDVCVRCRLMLGSISIYLFMITNYLLQQNMKKIIIYHNIYTHHMNNCNKPIKTNINAPIDNIFELDESSASDEPTH